MFYEDDRYLALDALVRALKYVPEHPDKILIVLSIRTLYSRLSGDTDAGHLTMSNLLIKINDMLATAQGTRL